MATLDQILAGMIEFRNTVYSRLDTIEQKINDSELNNYNICTMCHGSGEIIPSYNLEGTPPGPITCPSCEGSGKVLAGNSVEKT